MLVLNKPSGVPVHTAKGPHTPLENWFDQLTFGLPKPPTLAHRLDKDTSGCLVLARNPFSAKILGKLFESGRIQKTYLAVVQGCPNPGEGVIDMPLAPQSEKKYLWRVKVDPKGKSAITHYRVLEVLGGVSLVELSPKTGRTHQLRAHMAAIGCPILGDKAYGDPDSHPFLHLHASSITVPLYVKKDPIFIEAPIPSYFEETLQF